MANRKKKSKSQKQKAKQRKKLKSQAVVKETKKSILSKFKNCYTMTFFFETIYIITIEIILKLLLGSKVCDWSTLRIVFSSILLASIISLLSNFKSIKTHRLVLIIINLFITVYAWLQIGFIDYLGTFISLGNAEQGGKLGNYIIDFLTSYRLVNYLLYLPFFASIYYFYHLENTYFYENTYTKTYFNTWKKKLVLLVVITTMVGAFYGSVNVKFMQSKYQTISNKSLLFYPSNPSIAIKNFGTTAYFFLDLTSTLKGNSEETVTTVGNITKQPTNREIDDTLWQELIEEEQNTTLNTLNKFFISRNIPKYNTHTGQFKDKNLIMVLMESIGFAVFDSEYKDYFPTLYKMYKNGISSINNYSPRNNCGTGESEMTSEISLYSIETTCTVNTYHDNYYPEALLNTFKNSDYYTSVYHNYTDYYYDRSIYEYNFGAKDYFDVEDLGLEYTEEYKEWPSDLELMKSALPHFIDKDKFASYIVTVTAHTPYKYSSTYGDMYLSMFEDLDVDITVKRYLSKIKVLDLAMEYLLSELENSGKLDDTVIVLYGDHYPYSLSTKDYQSLASYDITVNQETDRTPFIIYNSVTTKETITKYMTPLDYTPTILNLFGLDYDPRYYVGNDVFSEYEDFILYADNSWQNEKGFYSVSKGEFIPVDSSSMMSDEDIIAMNEKVETLRTMSNLAIKNNYFKYLFEEIEKKKNNNGE